MLLGLMFIGAQTHAETRAAMSDYVWEVLPENARETEFSELCDDVEEESGSDPYQRLYLDCLQKAAENHDNRLSRQWGLSETLAREKDTIYIKVPNRRLPLTFREKYSVWSEDSNTYLTLEDYHPKNQTVTIEKNLWESVNTIMVNLKSGIEQEFTGTQLTFSPNRDYAATVDMDVGEQDVILWQLQADGLYHPEDTAEDVQARFWQHMTYYNGEDFDGMAARVTLEWVTDASLIADYYFKMNPEDTAAYRVRFNYVKPKDSDEWQLIPIR
ncbi:hypothetical protein GCM10009129_04140 [Psychrobacter aestuarii]|uniref:Uncharacterized protein n=1 Tax=Psychrobacter aestuarii TaxID=556327 RepID=A0ABP3FCA5_9GAMM